MRDLENIVDWRSMFPSTKVWYRTIESIMQSSISKVNQWDLLIKTGHFVAIQDTVLPLIYILVNRPVNINLDLVVMCYYSWKMQKLILIWVTRYTLIFISHLADLKICAMGTVRENRLKRCSFFDKKKWNRDQEVPINLWPMNLYYW